MAIPSPSTSSRRPSPAGGGGFVDRRQVHRVRRQLPVDDGVRAPRPVHASSALKSMRSSTAWTSVPKALPAGRRVRGPARSGRRRRSPATAPRRTAVPLVGSVQVAGPLVGGPGVPQRQIVGIGRRHGGLVGDGRERPPAPGPIGRGGQSVPPPGAGRRSGESPSTHGRAAPGGASMVSTAMVPAEASTRGDNEATMLVVRRGRTPGRRGGRRRRPRPRPAKSTRAKAVLALF